LRSTFRTSVSDFATIRGILKITVLTQGEQEMKNLIAGIAITMLVMTCGCNQGTPGGPGTTGEQPFYGQADNTFNLSVPVMSSSLQQGERATATIGINRAKNFDDDVKLSFTALPAGVTVDPVAPEIPRGRTEATVTFMAEDEAPLGDYVVKISGHPTAGSDAQIDFKLTVTPKDTFTLSPPRTATVQQGETQTVAVGITRDTTFDQDVTLTFTELPTGVTLQPQSVVIKQGEAQAETTLTAARDAALGNFTIKVTGRPAKGADAMNEFQLTVNKGEETKAVEETTAVETNDDGTQIEDTRDEDTSTL
jgi:hypothetical protein